MVLAGAQDAPHVWYMSRQGDPLDWDYAKVEQDVGRAVAGTNADAGKIGGPITALIPHSDDYLVFGCTNSLWVMRGDPAYGGQLDNLSETVGVVSRGAWCKGPEGETIFLSRDGLYMLASGASSYPVSVSRERLPRELLDVTAAPMNAITMAFDGHDRGVHLYITPIGAKPQVHWWFDWETKSFWNVGLQSSHEPFSILRYDAMSRTDSTVILGGRDGYLRRYLNESETDGGTEIESWIVYGPIDMGGGFAKGGLSQLLGVLAERSGDVTWTAIASDTFEKALMHAKIPTTSVDGSMTSTGTWTAGLNHMERPRIRGACLVLRLENGTTTRAWAVERIAALRTQRGKLRLA